MSETQNNPTAYQVLDHEQAQLTEVAKNAVEQRNSSDATADRFGILSCFGACMVLTPVLFFLIRLLKKLI